MRSERRRIWITLLFAVLLTVLVFVGVGCAADTYTVCPGGGCDYTSIQAAVNASSDGDTIIVHNGMYTENVDVNKSLTIRSQYGAAYTTVQAKNLDHVFNVTANYVNIGGFNVTGAGLKMAGIYLNNVNNCNVYNNTVNFNWFGIRLYSSSNNNLMNNIASNNTPNYGIYLYFSSNNSLTGNIANSNNNHGIFLASSINNFLKGNTANSNNYGIYLASSSNNTLADNTVTNNNNGIYLIASCNNNTLTGNTASNNSGAGILLLSQSNNNNLTDNTANSNSNWGIFLNFVCNNSLTGNTASNNSDGFSLTYLCNNNNLMDNTANSNSKYGIFLESSSNNNITCNWIHDNSQYGFYFDDSWGGSTGNTIAHNNIMANGAEQADGSWQYNFYNDQSENVTAEDNYWGTADEALINASIYDRYVNSAKGTVDYFPFLNAPAPCAPFAVSSPEVPLLTPTGLIALVSLLSAIAAVAIVRKRR